jgi:hypothetical protein
MYHRCLGQAHATVVPLEQKIINSFGTFLHELTVTVLGINALDPKLVDAEELP